MDEGIQPEIVITQNLIRGLNPDVNLADLRNAIDQNEIDKINFKNTISTAISDTLINYINIINANRKIHSLQRTLQINRDNLEQTKIKFQFGEASKSDVTNKRVSVHLPLSDLSSSKSERQGTINKLFDTMNVKSKKVTVENDLVKISHRFSVPSLEKAKRPT